MRQDFEIRPLSNALGAEVLGLDLSAPLSTGGFDRLHRAHLKHHVRVFRDQGITPAQQVAFSARWARCGNTGCTRLPTPGNPRC